ncbi:MAG: transposase [Methanosarcina sp.]
MAKLHEKISNQRNDFQHKLPPKLICGSQAVDMEKLNVKGMVQH